MAIIGKSTDVKFASFTTALGVDTIGSYGSAIANLLDIDLPFLKADAVESTNMASDNGTTIPGFDMPQQVNFSVQYDADGYSALVAVRRVEKYWKITLPDTATLVWKAWLNTVSGPVQMKDVIGLKVLLESQGDATFTEPS